MNKKKKLERFSHSWIEDPRLDAFRPKGDVWEEKKRNGQMWPEPLLRCMPTAAGLVTVLHISRKDTTQTHLGIKSKRQKSGSRGEGGSSQRLNFNCPV